MKIIVQIIGWLLGFSWETVQEPETESNDIMDQPLLGVGDEFISLGDGCSGVFCTGATGSGKSSSVGLQVIMNLLNHGLSGLVLTVKSEEIEVWQKAAAKCGRSEDLIIFGKDHHRFNFLAYESASPSGAGLTENVVSLLLAVLGSGAESKGSSDPYWSHAQKQLIRNILDLLQLSGQEVTVSNMLKVVNSAAQSGEEVFTEEWRNESFCFACLEQIENTDGKARDKSTTAIYWLKEFPNLSERTRSIVVSSLTSLLDSFARGVLAELFSTTTTFTPEDSFKGKIIVLALDVHTYKDIGIKAQCLFKMIWQRATERRRITAETKPVFLYNDESQFFFIKEGKQDMMWQTTCRGLRVITVNLTQSISNYLAVIGHNQDEIFSYLGNLRSKVFLANGNHKQNEWAAQNIGQTEQWKLSINGNDKGQGGYSLGQQFMFDVPLVEMQKLKMGTAKNDYLVEGIVQTPGRVWEASGKNWVKTTFKQVQL